MKCLVFDTGPIISLTMNNLLWILPRLKEKFGGTFYITPTVKKELIDVPLQTKKFKFEAVQVLSLIANGTLTIFDNEGLALETTAVLTAANTIYQAQEHYINIVHYGEISALVAAKMLMAPVIVMDEKTTRLLLESPATLQKMLHKTLHMPVSGNVQNLNRFRNHVGAISVIRSVELLMVAYEFGLFTAYEQVLAAQKNPNPSRELLESILWSVKLSGCAVSQKEIRQLIKLEAGKNSRMLQ